MAKREKLDSRRYVVIGIIAAVAVAGIVIAFSSTLFNVETGTDDSQPDAGEQALSPPLVPTAISVDPQEALPGDTIMVQGNGFSSGEQVEVALNNIAVETAPQNVVTDNSGQFAVEISLPQQEEGEYNVTARDESGNTASTVIILTSEPSQDDTSPPVGLPPVPGGSVPDPAQPTIPSQPPAATISVTRTAGQIGDVTISGDGFNPDERITIDVNGEELPVGETVRTDDIGQFTVDVILPEAEGQYLITATDESNKSASTTYD
jgi:hypothetical protein